MTTKTAAEQVAIDKRIRDEYVSAALNTTIDDLTIHIANGANPIWYDDVRLAGKRKEVADEVARRIYDGSVYFKAKAAKAEAEAAAKLVAEANKKLQAEEAAKLQAASAAKAKKQAEAEVVRFETWTATHGSKLARERKAAGFDSWKIQAADDYIAWVIGQIAPGLLQYKQVTRHKLKKVMEPTLKELSSLKKINKAIAKLNKADIAIDVYALLMQGEGEEYRFFTWMGVSVAIPSMGERLSRFLSISEITVRKKSAP